MRHEEVPQRARHAQQTQQPASRGMETRIGRFGSRHDNPAKLIHRTGLAACLDEAEQRQNPRIRVRYLGEILKVVQQAEAIENRVLQKLSPARRVGKAHPSQLP